MKIPYNGPIFEYNGINNRYYDLILTEFTMRQRPEERVDVITIEGRNGSLIDRHGQYESYERSFGFVNVRDEDVRNINAWLSGRGKLRTSIEAYGYQNVEVIDVLEREHIGREHNMISVTFLCDPFFYLDIGNHPIKISNGQKFKNPGTIYAEPLIQITGTGTGYISISGQRVDLKSMTGTLVIDCGLKICHENKLPAGKKMVGDFPVLPVGDFTINYGGGITSVSLVPRWREL